MSSKEHASLVNWREWSDEAFREAQADDKPILLDIGAVWCHWCHVMDDGIPGDRIHTGTYSNPEIAATINASYIPIKVDNDKRPDINARYNMGGWPTTAFLTPQGEPLYGETYIHPTRMAQLLPQIASYYKDNKGDIAARLSQHETETDITQAQNGSVDLKQFAKDELAWIDSYILSAFDESFAGFGNQPKFPHFDALEYALLRSLQTHDERLRRVFLETMEAMAGGGMYDQFAGGFFRYSTTRDWSIPHYEKMLEDNARLSRIAFLGARLLNNDKLAEIGRDVHSWLTTTMLDTGHGFFAGSQDADKEDEYYGRPLAEREHLPTPYIDQTVYLNWNALMVSSLCERYRLDFEQSTLDLAGQCYAFIKERIWPNHFFDSSGAGGSAYLLTDATALCEAALDLAEVTGDKQYNTDAVEIANIILADLDDSKHGGYFDMPISPKALGALSNPVKDLQSSSATATALLRLNTLTDKGFYAESATRAIQFCAGDTRRQGLFASALGLTLRYLDSPIHVVLVAELQSPDILKFQRALWQVQISTPITIEFLISGDSEEYAGSPTGSGRAYVCQGTQCNIFDSPEEMASSLSRSIQKTT